MFDSAVFSSQWLASSVAAGGDGVVSVDLTLQGAYLMEDPPPDRGISFELADSWTAYGVNRWPCFTAVLIFILANPEYDPVTGMIVLEKSTYVLEDFKIFKAGDESVNFSVINWK